ncbi:MAG: hypothetical protein HGA42_06540 [Nostocales cyanobacterium W4_Combined_metabat2_030]|jgi:hypothetical protein|nr:hypothetical protein [Nostocales cyanobacterium W4_Combined_metabat2_030]
MTIDAFVDNGHTPGREFSEQFLLSPEFTVETLKSILSGSSRLKKAELAAEIANALDKGKVTPETILLEYVKQRKTWLSLKQGTHVLTPNLKPAAFLLKEFGEDGWYGPIQEANQPHKKWYIRTHKIDDSGNRPDQRDIRWSVIAEVAKDYVALFWDGFSLSSTTSERIEAIQFPFWHHIPGFFDELANHCQANWKFPNLHKLVLHDMWDKYLNKSIDGIAYKWKHLRIRAEASGLAINARSAGVPEIDVRGLQALSEKLAESVLQKLGLVGDSGKMSDAEDAIVLTLIKEWGTKSYEFSLGRELTAIEMETDEPKKVKIESVIKAHCYFGEESDKTQDSLQHIKCYGGSTSVLEFLLKELELQG